ncbi:MAG: 4Fe-4S binding protein [Oscillospiraceae bacterium]|jgi:ferredoxin|nr:4Fe-4S binding protein [Oscillospiraceae bacterium]
MAASKNAAVVGNGCVACGACAKVCPKKAVRVLRGVRAVVDPERCVGCGKCARTCPAGVIVMARRDSL